MKNNYVSLVSVAGLVFFFALRTYIRSACAYESGNGFQVDFNTSITSGILTAAPVITLLSIGSLLRIDEDRMVFEKFGKLCVLAFGLVMIFWISYLAMQNDVCFGYVWRKLAVVLFAPLSSLTLVALTRRWLATND